MWRAKYKPRSVGERPRHPTTADTGFQQPRSVDCNWRVLCVVRGLDVFHQSIVGT